MKIYESSFRILASQQVVSGFHQSTAALRYLTPFPVWVQLKRIEPIQNNSRSEFGLWLGVIPINWLAVHRDVDFPNGFTDLQVYGPFNSWIHKHEFNVISDTETEVVDRVEAEFGSGIWKGMVSRLMWLGLPALFWYRGWVTKNICQSKII